MHHYNEIDLDTEDSSKPSIITFYNKTKSSVDVVNYTCARNTRRQHMVVLYSLLNIAAINYNIIFSSNNSSIDLKRRQFLMQLARGLISDYQNYRASLTMSR